MTEKIARRGARKCRSLSVLPFGEELQAGVGGRTSGQGYVGDNVRQQFAGSERDDESNLDFMQARYYSSAQGRFTSPDQPFIDQHASSPQSWNLYSYVRNNPLRLFDPTGYLAQDQGQRIVTGTNRGEPIDLCSGKGCIPGLLATVDVTATISDVPIVSETEILTGTLNPIPEQGLPLTSTLLNAASGNGGALAAGAVAEPEVVVPAIPLLILTAATYDVLRTAIKSIADTIGNPNIFSQSKHNKEVIDGLIGTAVEHLGKIHNDPTSRDVEHWRGEIRATLDRAKNIAERLKGNTKEATKGKIREIEQEAEKH